MPVPPKRLKELTEGTVDHHASLTHPDLQEITIRWRGSFGYMDAWAGEGDDNDERISLCRIEYLGGGDWAFALYHPATKTYENAVLRNGQYTGHPRRRLRHRRTRPPRRLPGVTVTPGKSQQETCERLH